MSLANRLIVGAILCLSIAITFTTWGDDFADQLPRIPPTEPTDALKTFQVADGYQMQLVASEPLIGSPVAIEWDADGRLFVCEMRGYSENRDDKISSIALLTDTDDDGVFDQRADFASGLNWPTAIFPFDGGLFVGDAPDLLYLKDTDGDGIADTKKVVLTGFGTTNVQGLMNSMRWGLDNRIHVACSSVGGKIQPAIGGDEPVNVRGRDLAFDPRTFKFTPTSGAAQHGMCFDDWGRKFVSSNSNHIMQVMYDDSRIARNPLVNAPSARVSIAVDGPQAEVFRTSPIEPWRIVRTRLRVSGQVPGPIEGGGRAAGYFTGATGITIYRGDAWPAADRGLAIVGDVGSNLIHRKRLKPSGLQFKAFRIDQESELVTSTDIWFRPAQFANAPDGSLHVIDVCREVIEHPKSLPPEIKQHLDLTAGRDRGRIYRLVPTGFQHRKTPKLSNASTAQWVDLLKHPNAWHRETASRLLFQRQDKSALAKLRQLVAATDHPLGSMHALHVLHGLNALKEPTLVTAMGHDHEQVRAHAIALADDLGIAQKMADQILPLANDPSLAVRVEVAYAIGNIDHPDRIAALAGIVGRDRSVWTRIAVQSSLAKSVAELFSVLVVDPKFRGSDANTFLSDLAAQVSQQDLRGQLWMTINAVGLIPDHQAAFVLPLLERLLKRRDMPGSSAAQLAAEGYFDAIDARMPKMIEVARQTADNPAESIESRTDAIGALALGSIDQVGEFLQQRIDERQPLAIQAAALNTLGQFDDPQVSAAVIDAWPSLSPSLRPTAMECLLSRSQRTLALFDAIDHGKLHSRDLPLDRLKILTRSKHSDIAARAQAYLAANKTGPRHEIVKRYSVALNTKGDVGQGETVFQKNCSACHKVGQIGNELGPSLASMKNRGADAILVNVLDPNREVNPAYLNYVVLMTDGRAASGMITSETANNLSLSRGEGTNETILRSQIQTLQSTGVSIMPEGFERTIDPQSMADLLAFLMQTK